MRGLMNSRLPISGFESPSRASRAIWASWAVRSSRSRQCVFGALSGGQQLALGSRRKRLSTHRAEHLVSGAELLTGVEAPALAAQPFAVEQMGAGKFGADAGTTEPLDRLAVKRSASWPSLRSARERASMPSAQSVPLGACGLRKRRQASAAGPARRHGQQPRSARPTSSARTPSPRAVCLPAGRGQRVLISPKPVVEHAPAQCDAVSPNPSPRAPPRRQSPRSARGCPFTALPSGDPERTVRANSLPIASATAGALR